jgi:hypothetical protein
MLRIFLYLVIQKAQMSWKQPALFTCKIQVLIFALLKYYHRYPQNSAGIGKRLEDRLSFGVRIGVGIHKSVFCLFEKD